MESYRPKVFTWIASLLLAIISIELVPISNQSKIWNKCIKTTASFLDDLHGLKEKGKAGREAIAVNICNGAVHYRNQASEGP